MNSDPNVPPSSPPPLPGTAEELLPLVNGELRRLAASRMAQEFPGMTIQATALVHEAWMRLEREQKGWKNRAQFFAAAAEAMRRILIEQARRRVSEKRGAGVTHDPLMDSIIEITASNDEIFEVHEALDALAAADQQAADLVVDHPNIAKVFDGGATQSGRPFFVMELIRSVKLTDYCDEQQLSTPARLALFIHVCQAVQHAHQKGIIHRDLKPSNILVTINDGEAVPMVIDFGVAKATQGRLTDVTLFPSSSRWWAHHSTCRPSRRG